MKYYFLTILFFIFIGINCSLWGQHSATINRVIAYCPAPGQHINRLFPPPDQSDTYENVLKYINRVLVGNNNQKTIGLGAFGGYIIVGFDHSIINKKGEYDFKGFGNAFQNNSEPGVVMVCQDLNKNGQPDANETWYELAGSEHNNPHTVRNYKITYYRPNQVKQDVKWIDNQGNKGVIKHISYATQNHIFPNWITEDTLTFKGTKLPNNIVKNGSSFNLTNFDYGYMDNHSNDASIEKNGFKIDWAIDKEGNHIDLEYIDFIRIHTGQLQQAGWLGETSTELAGIEDLHFPKANKKIQISINNNILTILGTNNLKEISFFDLNGRKIHSVQKKTTINLSSLSKGIYIIELKLNEQKIIYKKIIL